MKDEQIHKTTKQIDNICLLLWLKITLRKSQILRGLWPKFMNTTCLRAHHAMVQNRGEHDKKWTANVIASGIYIGILLWYGTCTLFSIYCKGWFYNLWVCCDNSNRTSKQTLANFAMSEHFMIAKQIEIKSIYNVHLV